MDLQDDMELQDVDTDSTEDDDIVYEDIFSESYLMLILRQIIQSREVLLIHSNDEDTTPRYRMKMPTIRRKPNLERLKKSSIYRSIKQASGHKADDTNPEQECSLMKMVMNRQTGLSSKAGSFTQYDKCKINNMFTPNKREKVLCKLDTKAFCGKFSRDDAYFLTASQDHKVRVFDATTSNYNLINRIPVKDVSWCILDIDFSPDKEHFIYSTWSDCLYMSKICDDQENIECFFLKSDLRRFCIFSMAFSNCGFEVIGGANDGCLYIYNCQVGRRILKIPVINNKEDVNAVGFVDESSNILFTGGDDSIVKLWDRRTMNESAPKPVGKLIGHFDGITYIDPRNDGRHLISNSKDQSIKLWDIRKFSPGSCEKAAQNHIKQNQWDYRWDAVPRTFYNPFKPIEGDTSIVTYRGHRVQKSLIRAKFSPMATTGQRYIYTGCATGRVVIYDVLTGKIVSAIKGHTDIVRDVAWHSKRPEIISCSWDFSINLNTYVDANRNTTKRLRDGVDKTNFTNLRRSKRIALKQNQQSST